MHSVMWQEFVKQLKERGIDFDDGLTDIENGLTP